MDKEARRQYLEDKIMKELEKLKQERGTEYALLVSAAGYAAENIAMFQRKYPNDEKMAIRFCASHAQLLAILCTVMKVSEKDVMADVDRIEAIMGAEEWILKVKEKMQ